MKKHFLRAVRDILQNRFLNLVTIITFAFSVLIVGAFGLFFINANDMMETWKKGIRMMVYLVPETSEAARLDTKFRLQSIAGVKHANFISRTEGLARLKELMKHRPSLLENLRENPLPDTFELTIDPEAQQDSGMEFLAKRIESLPSVEDVEYGQKWVERFTNVVNLFRVTGYALGSLFFMATVFIVANTIRLVLYSRRDEIEVMRLVGATDSFIKGPFYFQGIIQGAMGSLVGLSALFGIYLSIASHMDTGLTAELLSFHFFNWRIISQVMLGGMVVGWLGSFLSLQQFLKH